MRTWLLLLIGFSIAGAVVFACSSSSPTDSGNGDDASSEGSTTDDGGSGDDGAIDAGSDTGSGDDGGPSCTGLPGTCDLVKQNCPQGKECSFVSDNTTGAITAACVTAGTGNKPIGAKCCPDQANQCVAGLQCVGGTACTGDAGATGRCAPFCCPGNDQTCGSSIPEGFRGTCDTNLVTTSPDGGGNISLGNVCTYKGVCTPFHVQPCPSDYACLLQGDGVSFRCSSIFSPPGKAVGESCNAANDCADGMECLGPADGGSTCRIICYHPDGGAPFDGGGLQNGAPGYGGCPVGKGCGGSITGAPAWMGFCTP